MVFMVLLSLWKMISFVVSLLSLFYESRIKTEIKLSRRSPWKLC